MICNEFYQQFESVYVEYVMFEKLFEILGRGWVKKGMFEGDMIEGELEVGQIFGLIYRI